MTLSAGTGKLEHDDDGVKNGKLHHEQLGDLSVDEVRLLLQANSVKPKFGEVEKMTLPNG